MNAKRTTVLIALLAFLAGPGFLSADVREEEIEATPGELLRVEMATGGSVQVVGWDRNLVSVESEATGRDRDKQTVEVRRTSNGVLVKTETIGKGNHHKSGFEISIRVPRRFNVEIESMGGDISVEDVEGKIGGETMGGDLDLSNLTGVLKLSTMGGDIELTDSRVDGEVSTMGGDVMLENVIGDVNGSSMGGDVSYKNVTRPDGSSTGQAVTITTMGGDIELGEAMSGATLETMGGDIELARAAVFVDAETMGGDIVLGSVDGRVTANTMGGDVEVTVVGDPQAADRDIEIDSKGGDIHLTVPRNFSMEVDIEIAYTKGRSDKYEIISDAELEISESDSWTKTFGSPRKIISAGGSFNGGGNDVKIRTINGDVYLKYAN
ncbi:MAG: DUF4097 domain-containing protein [Acidobacteriota bacterium]|nr:DUF4097 domain-containing protein [Acidobacteriota bacterium]